MLESVTDGIWVAEQSLKFVGLPIRSRMTAIRLSDRSLLLISPIPLNDRVRQQLAELGTVKYLIAPNLFHHLYIAECQQLYPQAKAIAPPGLTIKQPNLKIDLTFTEDKIDFSGELEYLLFEGFAAFVPPKIRQVNEIVFYHPRSKTLIITDSAFNFDSSFPLITQFATRIIGSYQTLKPSWLEKISIRDRQLLKQSIDRILAWDFQRVIMAHGKIVDTDAKEQLAAGYRWLIE